MFNQIEKQGPTGIKSIKSIIFNTSTAVDFKKRDFQEFKPINNIKLYGNENKVNSLTENNLLKKMTEIN